MVLYINENNEDEVRYIDNISSKGYGSNRVEKKDLMQIYHQDPIKNNERIRVYHGCSLKTAVTALKLGLSGKERALRNYSYEYGMNPVGLFVTTDFEIAKRFGYDTEAMCILEFTANSNDLDTPVWNNQSSFFGQNTNPQPFDSKEDRDLQKQNYQLDAYNSKEEHIKKSDNPAMAERIFNNPEHQALFIGDLNPNMIKRVWVNAKDEETGYVSTSKSYVPYKRVDFLKKYGEKEFYIDGTPNQYSKIQHSTKLFLPNEDFTSLKDMAERQYNYDMKYRGKYLRSVIEKKYNGDEEKFKEDKIIDDYNNFSDALGEDYLIYDLKYYLWPKQLIQLIGKEKYEEIFDKFGIGTKNESKQSKKIYIPESKLSVLKEYNTIDIGDNYDTINLDNKEHTVTIKIGGENNFKQNYTLYNNPDECMIGNKIYHSLEDGATAFLKYKGTFLTGETHFDIISNILYGFDEWELEDEFGREKASKMKEKIFDLWQNANKFPLLGRIFWNEGNEYEGKKYEGVITTWDEITKNTLLNICKKLNVNPNDTLYTNEDYITYVSEFKENNKKRKNTLPKETNSLESRYQELSKRRGDELEAKWRAEHFQENISKKETVTENYRELEIPFDGNPEKLNYLQFLDHLEEIGRFGKLQSSKYNPLKDEQVTLEAAQESFYFGWTEECDELDDEEWEFFLEKIDEKYETNIIETVNENELTPWDILEYYFYEENEYEGNIIYNELCDRGERLIKALKNACTWKNGLVYVERAIKVSDLLAKKKNYFNKLEDMYSGIGQYWSWFKGGANTYFDNEMTMYDEDEDSYMGEDMIILKGYVDPKTVRWGISCRLYEYVSNEYELRLDSGEVEIDEITTDDGRHLPLPKPLIVNVF